MQKLPMSSSSSSSFNWIFAAKDHPKIQVQRLFRQKLAVLIYDLGKELEISESCVCTAIVYMHRFYSIQPVNYFLPQRVCATVLFLACKVADKPVALQDIILALIYLLRGNADQVPDDIIEHYRNEIIHIEEVLLSTLGFSFTVIHSYQVILEKIQKLKDYLHIASGQNLEKLTSDACQLAVKSIFLTSFCVQYSPELIACFSIQSILNPKTIRIVEQDGSKSWMQLVDQSIMEKDVLKLINEFQSISKNYPEKWHNRLYPTQTQTLTHRDSSVGSTNISPRLIENTVQQSNSGTQSLTFSESTELNSPPEMSLSSTLEPSILPPPASPQDQDLNKEHVGNTMIKETGATKGDKRAFEPLPNLDKATKRVRHLTFSAKN